MPFLKRIMTAIAAISLIAIGGSGTQSSSLAMQGAGVLALIVGIVILVVFGKMLWRAIGCFGSIVITAAICLFILYAIGAFADGVSSAPNRLKSFLGGSRGAIETSDSVSTVPMLTESMPSPQKKEPSPQEKAQAQAQPQTQGFNPMQYPSISTPVEVIKANVLRLNSGQYIRLFGIDSPDIGQTCSNKQGRSYKCGRQAAAWLKSWLSDYEVRCHIISMDAQSNAVGVCFLGEYDIAAATTNAGWSVATTEGGGIYKAYENVANSSRRGLWQGQFYRPADWRNFRNLKVDVNVEEHVQKKKSRKKEGLFGF